MTSTTTTSPAVPASTSAPTDPLLSELLDRELDWSPLARPPYISHFAMGLVAARRLGANDDELRRHFEQAAASDFHVWRGPQDWLAADTARIEAVGIDHEVASRLPAVLDAPGIQFFHAVIRLELAIDAAHTGQVASALRNWEEAAGSGKPGHPFDTPADGTADGTADDGSRGAVDDPVAAMVDLSVLAARAYLAQPDFGTLHLVTGTRALSTMLAHLGPEDQRRLAVASRRVVLGHLDPAVLAGAEVLAAAEDPAGAHEAAAHAHPIDWDAIGRAALDTGDVHIAKLVYACRLQIEATGDAHFADVAETAVVDASAR